MYTRDDFNYAELIARRQRFWHVPPALRRHRAAASYALSRSGGGDEAGSTTCRADRAAVGHIFRAPTRATRPASYSWPSSTATRITSTMAGRAGEHALDAAPGRTVPAGRQGRAALATRSATRLHEDDAGNARHRASTRDSSNRPSLAVAEYGDGPQAGRSRSHRRGCARATASAPSIHGATRSQRSGSIAPCARCATPASNCRAIVAAACSLPTRRDAAKCVTTIAARLTKRRRWARRASCWSPGACRNIRAREARPRRIF